MPRWLLTAAAAPAIALGAAVSASAEMQQRSIPGGGVDQQQAGVPSTTPPRVAGVDLASGQADPAWLIRPSAVVITHGGVGSRPPGGTAPPVVMDASVGPAPLVMAKDQLAADAVTTFVVSQVPEGAVVEKWDGQRQEWVRPAAARQANPSDLLRLLDRRLITTGDAIRWVPPTSAPAAQRAFSMSDWVRAGMPVPTRTVVR